MVFYPYVRREGGFDSTLSYGLTFCNDMAITGQFPIKSCAEVFNRASLRNCGVINENGEGCSRTDKEGDLYGFFGIKCYSSVPKKTNEEVLRKINGRLEFF